MRLASRKRNERIRSSKGWLFRGFSPGAWALGHLFVFVSSCSTTQVEPLPVLPPAPPPYVSVPHPQGMDLGDVMAVFTDMNAPSPSEVATCDEAYRTLQEKTQSQYELDKGATELVKADAVHYHWCFYGKLLELERKLGDLSYVDEKQDAVLTAYTFLTPIARAFQREYNDSRYLHWAVVRYRKLSELVFYRRVEVSPDQFPVLSRKSNHFLEMKPHEPAPDSVLGKYGIEVLTTAPQASEDNASESDRAPASQVGEFGLEPKASSPGVISPGVISNDSTQPGANSGAENAEGGSPLPGPPDLQGGESRF